jgi:NADPH:quinone reductase-like Zn-dependent oxidoreductase
MKAVQGMDYGDIDAMLSLQNDVLVPRLSDLPPKQQKQWMLIKVLAVALAPGDCRVLSGLTRELQGPPSFPYIPGGDCCGIVVELPEPPALEKGETALPFAVGDRVVARFVEAPRGALGEYALVSTMVADKVPDGLSSEDASALISASPSIDLAQPFGAKQGERVLVLGAGGGMGAHFCQLLRAKETTSYVVGVSRTPKLLLAPPISCDEAIDYTTTDVFSMTKFQGEENQFDTIVDLAGGGYARLEDARKRGTPSIVKPASQGGRFITTVPPHGPTYEIHSIWAALKIFLFPCLWKAIVSRTLLRGSMPKYSFGFVIAQSRRPATQVMQLAAQGQLEAVIEPFPFTTEGVRKAFRLVESRHAHGKVVIAVAKS